MRCGQECPCCSGSMAGEFCELQSGFDGVTHFPEMNKYEVNCTPPIPPFGDPCQLNIVKYLIKYMEYKDDCKKLWYGESF